jgi:hypothetical protein
MAHLPMTIKRPLTRYSALALAVSAVLAFYAWAASPGQRLFARLDGEGSYYSLLVKGFRAGHLSLQVEVPPGVLLLKNPYDPKQNAPFGMHDVSYFKGKFYLYFGAGPAVALYWPIAAVSGHYLNDKQAVFLFASIGFLAGALLVLAIHQRYAPRLGLASEIAGVLAVGFATMVPVLLRRQEVYEVAISSAHAFFFLSLLCLFQSIHRERNLAWCAAASLSYGLAIASRPTYIFGAASLLVPLFFNFRPGPRGSQTSAPRLLWRAFAAIVPVSLVVGGVLLYNDLRFDSPFEFGHQFAFSGANETTVRDFSISFFWFNCRAYLFEPAHLSSYFPFVRVASMPAAPAGYMGVEDPYGVLPNIPFAVLALAAPLACINRPSLRIFVTSVIVAVLAVAVVIFTFQFAANRYMVDFLPGVIILSVIGFWGLAERFAGLGGRLVSSGCVLLLAWSVLFNIFAAFGHNEFLRTSDPLVYRRLVHAFDSPRLFVDRLIGRTYGPLELVVKFPKGRKGKVEPLVISGSDFLSDYLYVYYESDEKIVLGFEHTSYGGPVTSSLPIDYGRPHRIDVDMPPLYPPVGDPYFDRLPAAVVDAFNERLRVSFDGVPVIETAQQFYPPFSARPSIGGGTASQVALGKRFTGDILSIGQLEADWRPPQKTNAVGPLVISLEFPVVLSEVPEPLVSVGYAGRGDILSVKYLDTHHVTFSFDHWGSGGATSAPVEVKPGVRQSLEVGFGSFFPAAERPPGILAAQWADSAGKLEVVLDGRKVFESRATFYDVPAETLVLGRNSIGSSSCAARFSGKIIASKRGNLK